MQITAVLFILAHQAAMEGHLPCLKFLVSSEGCPQHTLGARNDHGETPRDLAQQFYKENILEYIDHVLHEVDHPEEAESKRTHWEAIVDVAFRFDL